MTEDDLKKMHLDLEQMQVTIFKLSASVSLLMSLLINEGRYSMKSLDDAVGQVMDGMIDYWPRKE